MEQLDLFFPSASVTNTQLEQIGMVSIPRSDGKWLNLKSNELTRREQLLLEQLLSSEKEGASSNPWYAYLVRNQGPLPSQVRLVQFLHVQIIRHTDQNDFEAEWLDVLTHLLPNLVTSLKITPDRYVFILNQDPHFSVESIMAEILASMEFDFGMTITAFLGQMWPEKMMSNWAEAYQLEAHLFSHNLHKASFSGFNQFSITLLRTAGETSADLYSLLAQLIMGQDDMEETIKALWEEQAVVTKAAQKLYIHRNTLQYRLDKFQEQTGLSLKNMDDLAVCYVALLQFSS
ncbi:helix-turn-helix domain-containing protein [Streptococcus moroccensis]|uniref:DNA-binding PucR family transcriptional regulator n=1 Tax=Streptococcus moroccensis TaxID=1451356 RepID=A0ABT9YT68_9STRE|nr:helix-turn-helix domain-containing protein [Streptococcus moroccensis]MDQ0223168.1 DNA-binding PucR family transcriptional regulator [Streptococcus moroccensis]